MVIIKEKKRDTRYGEYDYLIDKYKIFKKLLPYITPKIDGKWKVILTGVKLGEVEELLLMSEDFGDWADIVVFLERDIVERVLERHPKVIYERMSSWEIYLEYISTLDVIIDNKALRAIYDRCNRSIDSIQEEMPRIIEKAAGYPITIQVVNKCLVNNKRIYASQVVRDFLYNSKYRWLHYDQLRRDIGDKIAFYAMRKYLRKLLSEKNKYLRNEATKDRCVKDIDSYTISYASLQFENAATYACCPQCLLNIERRRTNAYKA